MALLPKQKQINTLLLQIIQFTYLPHRPVVKPSRTATKICIVYGGSTKTKGPSLNETLRTGPSLLTLIFDIFLQFRMNPLL